MQKGYLKNTITYTIIVLSWKIFKQISEVFVTGYMMSGNQILVKSASSIDSHIIIIIIIIFSSLTKKSYSLSVNPVLDASVKMNKRFSKFTCDNWFRSRVLTRFIFEKNLSTRAVLRGKINMR